MQFVLGSVLIISGVIKLVEWGDFAKAYKKFDFFENERVIYIYHLLEILFGMSFFITRHIGLLAAAIITFLVINSIGIIRRYRREGYFRIIPSGALVPTSRISRILGENVVMVLLGIMVFFSL